MKSKVIRSAIPVLCCVLFAGYRVKPGYAQDVTGSQTKTIQRSVPLFDAAGEISGRYATPVTFEDALFQRTDDLVLTGADPTRAMAWASKQRVLRLPPEVSPATTPRLTAEALAALLEGYRRDNLDAPRFKVLSSNYGLHIVPDMVRDENGEWVRAGAPLDVTVAIPRATRLASEHLALLADAVARANGMKVSLIASQVDYYYAASGQELSRSAYVGLITGRLGEAARSQYSFEWGAAGVSARDALISLLSGSATTLVWELGIHPNPNPALRLCMFNVSPIQVTVAGPEGQTVRRTLTFDRCTRCPALLHPPVPNPPR